MRRVAAYLLAPLLWALPMSEGRGGNAPVAAYWYFGLSLSTGMNNELFTLFLVKEFEGTTLANEPITRGQFVMQAQGALPSKANPQNLNFFQRYEVGLCLPPAELAIQNPVVTDCSVFDQLWKLRFWEYPFRMQEGQRAGKGWAENRTTPSARQFLLLSDYGIEYMHSMACGEDVFRLLRDVGDSAWVDNYRKGY